MPLGKKEDGRLIDLHGWYGGAEFGFYIDLSEKQMIKLPQLLDANLRLTSNTYTFPLLSLNMIHNTP